MEGWLSPETFTKTGIAGKLLVIEEARAARSALGSDAIYQSGNAQSAQGLDRGAS